MNEDGLRPLDDPDAETPEALRRALGALAREQPSTAALRVGALRLEAALGAGAGHGGARVSTQGPWSTLTGKLVIAALVLGAGSLALRPSTLPTVAPAEAPGAHGLQTASPVAAAPPMQIQAAPHAAPTEVPPSPAAPRETLPTRAEVPQAAARVSAAPRASRVRPAPARASSTAPEPPEPSADRPATEPAGGAAAVPTASAALAERAAEARPARAPDGELALLLDARKHARNDPAATLLAAAEHARLFPTGELAPEREVLAIRALRALGREPEAEARLLRFRARYPGSVHLSGLQQR
jgi:hypothetical protein